MLASPQLCILPKTAFIVALAGCTAPKPDVCAYRLGNDGIFDAPRDAGNGFVLNKGGFQSGAFGGEASLSLMNCQSGEQVSFVYYHIRFGHYLDQLGLGSDDVIAAEAFDSVPELEKLILGDADNTIDDLITFATNNGMIIERSISEEEDCGCAVFYPHLRGDKAPSSDFALGEENRVI